MGNMMTIGILIMVALDTWKLDNVGVMNFCNNKKCKVKGYGKVTNGNFTVNSVEYIEGLQHNLISDL